MVVREKINNKDLSITDYQKRQWQEIASSRIEHCAFEVQQAGNFRHMAGSWLPNEYTGFAVVSMVEGNPSNSLLPFQLKQIQLELEERLSGTDSYYMLPPASFHQTLANTLSNERFKQKIVAPGIESSYPHIVEQAFGKIPPVAGESIKMKLIGLSIFSNALGILGTFEQEEDYTRILHFRSHFYNDLQLSNLDVRMTRPFIGHVTLAYVERELDYDDRLRLAKVVREINERLYHGPLYFHIDQAELRRYQHLAEFKKQNHFPVFRFNS